LVQTPIPKLLILMRQLFVFANNTTIISKPNVITTFGKVKSKTITFIGHEYSIGLISNLIKNELIKKKIKLEHVKRKIKTKKEIFFFFINNKPETIHVVK